MCLLAGACRTRVEGDGSADDPYLWLEEIEGPRALEWVDRHSQQTLSALGAEPVFDSIFQESLTILNADDRIPSFVAMGDYLYEHWQDEAHERGVWRRISWDSYVAGSPDWETLIDIDRLAAEESEPWVWWGARCLGPDFERCLIRLSRAGATAREIREFDLATAQFVEDGFIVPEGMTMVAWRSLDELLISTDYGEDGATTAGNPRTAKLWRRGESLAEAETLFEGEVDDVAVIVANIEVAGGSYPLVLHRKGFYDGDFYAVSDTGLVKLDIPTDATPTFVRDQMVLQLSSDWDVAGVTYPQDAVLAIAYEGFLEGRRDFTEVWVPTERQTVVGRVVATRDHLLLILLDNARTQLRVYREVSGEWSSESVNTSELGTVRVAAASPHSNRFFFSFGSHVQPTTLYLVEEDGSIQEVRRLPEMYDAQDLVIVQNEAVSLDGTRVPYFMVHERGLVLDGTNPTLLYGYGGFQDTEISDYSPVLGKAWLERGGVWAVANIRGGGELGPAWHQAALRENRQRGFDDFLAVARDLIANGVTSPSHLGINGMSNGGLLVGVALTQAPELFSAAAIQVPLLDMRRFNKLGAGAGWLAEYGNPDEPEEWSYLRRYSPYHNLRENTEYPIALFYTTTLDDRVHPGHGRKMAARMEEMGHRVLFFESREGGHGGGVTPQQEARRHAILFTYLLRQLGN